MRPDAHADEHDRHRGGGHEFVAEQHLAAEDRNDFGNHPERRQNENVNLRMAEEPKQMLPHVGRAAVLRVEKLCAQHAIEFDHDQRRGQRRNRQQNLHARSKASSR